MIHRRSSIAVAALVAAAFTVPNATFAQGPDGRSSLAPMRPRTVENSGALGSGRTVLTFATSSQPPSDSPLANGRVLYIRSRTINLHASLLEEKLMARPEFARLGLSITREEGDAQLFIVVERSTFTTKFTYTVLDPGTKHVLATGQVNSLFGTASGKIAKELLTKLVAARRAPNP